MAASITRSVSRAPMTLRSRSVAELVDTAFSIYRGRFVLFLAIVAVAHVPLRILFEAVSFMLVGSVRVANTAGGNLLLAYLQEFPLYFTEAALVSAVLSAYSGGAATFGGAYREAARHIKPLLALIGLQMAVWAALFAISIIPVLAAPGFRPRAASGLLAFSSYPSVLFLPYYIVQVRLVLAVPAVVMENLGVREALRRSWALTGNYWWRTVALLVVLNILGTIVALSPAPLLTALITTVVRLGPVVARALTVALNVATTLLFVPVQLTAIILYYLDQRVRKEALDLEMAVDGRYGPASKGQRTPQDHNSTPDLPAWHGAPALDYAVEGVPVAEASRTIPPTIAYPVVAQEEWPWPAQTGGRPYGEHAPGAAYYVEMGMQDASTRGFGQS